MSDSDATLIASDRPFSAEQQAVLERLLDLMIPASADGRMPSAAGLNLFAERGRLEPEAVAMLAGGCRLLDGSSRERYGEPFAALDSARAGALLDQARHAHSQFFGVFSVQAVARYYQHDHVLLALGLEPRPPWPAGHQVPEGDWTLLDPVLARARIEGVLYRE